MGDHADAQAPGQAPPELAPGGAYVWYFRSGTRIIPIAIEDVPAPADQPFIKSYHATGLAADVIRPLYLVQENLAKLDRWASDVLGGLL